MPNERSDCKYRFKIRQKNWRRSLEAGFAVPFQTLDLCLNQCLQIIYTLLQRGRL